MIDCIHLGDGAVNCSAITIRCIAEHALRKHAASAVLAHNHPKGLTIPSGADYTVTQTVESALETIGVPLLEHIIVTENSYAPIMRQHKGLLRSSPVDGKIDKEFYQRFYGEK
jgi:DNA repair protein RadC